MFPVPKLGTRLGGWFLEQNEAYPRLDFNPNRHHMFLSLVSKPVAATRLQERAD